MAAPDESRAESTGLAEHTLSPHPQEGREAELGRGDFRIRRAPPEAELGERESPVAWAPLSWTVSYQGPSSALVETAEALVCR